MMLENTLKVTLLILSVYRLSMLIAYDNGPLGLIRAVRDFSGRNASNSGILWQSFAELVNCPYCLGVWFALFGYILFMANHPLADFIIIVFGLAGGQALLERCSNGTE